MKLPANLRRIISIIVCIYWLSVLPRREGKGKTLDCSDDVDLMRVAAAGFGLKSIALLFVPVIVIAIVAANSDTNPGFAVQGTEASARDDTLL